LQRSLTDAAQQLICNQQVIGSIPIANSVYTIIAPRILRISKCLI
jgi:hypothetical protein